MRVAKPWFREQNQTWYVWHGGKQVKLGKNEAKAQEKHRALLKCGRPVSGQTVRQVVAAYWKWAKRNLAPATYERRKPILDSFSKAVPPSLAADELKPYHVQKWIDANDKVKVRKTKDGAKRVVVTDRDISKTTENTRIGLIKGVMNWARTMGYVDQSPIADMRRPAANIRQDFLPADAWPRVLELATDEPFGDYLTVMLSSGARPQEMRKFEAKHLSDNRFILPIEDSKGKRRSRVVYLPDDALAIVRRRARAYPEGKLFRNRKGRPWSNNAVRCRFRYLKRTLGLTVKSDDAAYASLYQSRSYLIRLRFKLRANSSPVVTKQGPFNYLPILPRPICRAPRDAATLTPSAYQLSIVPCVGMLSVTPNLAIAHLANSDEPARAAQYSVTSPSNRV